MTGTLDAIVLSHAVGGWICHREDETRAITSPLFTSSRDAVLWVRDRWGEDRYLDALLGAYDWKGV